MESKHIIMAPLDPVHDVGVRMIARALEEGGHQVTLLPPDSTPEDVVKKALAGPVDAILVGRTIGYGVGEILARLADMLEAAGLRPRVQLAIGGMAVKPELAAELGYDAGFGPGTRPADVLAFIEGRASVQEGTGTRHKVKTNSTPKYDYRIPDRRLESLLETITDQVLQWTRDRTSPGIERARVREEMIATPSARAGGGGDLRRRYAEYCGGAAADFYAAGTLPPGVRPMSPTDLEVLEVYCEESRRRPSVGKLQHLEGQPAVFVQYGTGCPAMDVAHIKASEAWGADGVIHFDPTWSARTEGLHEGYLTQEETGTLYTPEIIRLIKRSLDPGTLWTLRAHRGLNTPEIVVLAGLLGADMVKINITYGALSGGTDPARLTADGAEAIRYAAKYNLPFDIPVGHELSGVPTAKTFAGMLILAALGLKLGARPILNPLFCYSPNVILEGRMDRNYVDYNAARILALRRSIHAPIRAGEPVAFMTHTEDRAQSAVTTSLHAGLAMSLGVDAVAIASTDEAYSGGAISVASRIDTLKGVREAFRFFGDAGVRTTDRAEEWAEDIFRGTLQVLERVAARGDFVEALYDGLLGDSSEGAHPGKAGKNTVTRIAGSGSASSSPSQ